MDQLAPGPNHDPTLYIGHRCYLLGFRTTAVKITQAARIKHAARVLHRRRQDHARRQGSAPHRLSMNHCKEGNRTVQVLPTPGSARR
jgi:hypothetical protein